MATRRPRITISLRREDYAVLKRLSVANQVPMSRAVTDLVEAAAPYLGRAVEVVEQASKLRGPGLVRELAASLGRIEDDVRPHAEATMQALDTALEKGRGAAPVAGAKRRPGALNPRPCNHGGQVGKKGPKRGGGRAIKGRRGTPAAP